MSEEAAEPKKKSKLPLILAAVGLTLGLGGAGFGAYAWKSSKDAAAAESEDDEDAPKKPKADKAAKGKSDKKKAKERKPAVFVPMDTFTVNLQGGPREQFLQVSLVLEVRDGVVAESIKADMPMIRGKVLLLLASSTAAELGKPEGKDELAGRILERVREPAEGIAHEGVERVHYSAFIIQ